MAQVLRDQIKAAKVANNNRFARKALREIRGLELWREMGYKSFNGYVKSGDCPYSSNYAYKMSAAIEEKDMTRIEPAPAVIISLPTEQELKAARKGLLESKATLADFPGQSGDYELTKESDHVIFTESAVLPVKDLCGNVLSKKMAELFENANYHFSGLYTSVHDMRQTLRCLAAEKSGASFAVHNRMEVIMQHLHSIEGIVNNCRPYSVCIFCSGNRRKCAACGGCGFLSENQYIDATAKRKP